MHSSVKSYFRNGPVVLVSREIAYTFPLSYAYLAGYIKKGRFNNDNKSVKKTVKTIGPIAYRLIRLTVK